MKKFSLRRRLIAAVVMSQLLLATGLVVVGSYYSRYYLQSAFEVRLEGLALNVAALVYYPDDGSPGLLFNSSKVPLSAHHTHKDMFLVRSDQGNFERHSKDYDPSLSDRIPAQARYWDFQWQGEPYRAIILRNIPILDTEAGVPQPFPRLTVLYAAPMMDISQRIAGLATSIAVASLILVIPTMILAIWSIRRTLTPLNELASQARSISVRNWTFRPSDEAKSTAELEPLIAAIDTVLAGLQREFTRQREFLGDAAHELKTSLAILKSSWQSLLNRQRSAEEYRQGLSRISEDSDRLEELLDRMLRLARVEQWAADGIHRHIDAIDLALTCQMAIAKINQLAAGKNVSIKVTAIESAMISADSEDLELVWVNLLENAVKYSPAGSKVTMLLKKEGEVAVVSVSDSGPGISESELPRIFERFVRGDPSRSRASGGFGLGLAIAKAVVEAYKGSIHAESKLGEGTRIFVCLPILPAPWIINQSVVREGDDVPSSAV